MQTNLWKSGESLVEAYILTPENADELAEWSEGKAVYKQVSDELNDIRFVGLHIPTFGDDEGLIEAGDYVIRNENGVITRSGATNFEASYEPLKEINER